MSSNDEEKNVISAPEKDPARGLENPVGAATADPPSTEQEGSRPDPEAANQLIEDERAAIPSPPPSSSEESANSTTDEKPGGPVEVEPSVATTPSETLQSSTSPATPTNFSLPNGKDGEEYRIEHLKEKIFGESAEDISNYYIEGLEQTGIELLETEDTLAGTPTLVNNEPKCIRIELFYHLRSQPRARPFQHHFRFTINPDPRKLWKNIPSDREAPYWKSDEDCDRLEEPGIGQLIAASLRGRSHAHEGTCRDDHYAIKYFHQSGWWLSIIADGAGSAKYSRKGSEIACSTGARLFEDSIPMLESAAFTQAISELAINSEEAEIEIRTQLQELFIRKVGYPVFAKIFEHAKTSSHRAKDYNTTFLISTWKRTSEGWFAAAFAIGDGGIAVVHGNDVTALSKGDEGEFSGETVFLTSTGVWQDPDALLERVNFGLFSEVRGIYGMTDGITDPKFETDHNFSQPEKWSEFEKELEVTLQGSGSPENLLLEWMNFWNPGNHDDRTLTLFKPVPHPSQ